MGQPQAGWTEKHYEDVPSQDFKTHTAAAGENCKRWNAGYATIRTRAAALSKEGALTEPGHKELQAETIDQRTTLYMGAHGTNG